MENINIEDVTTVNLDALHLDDLLINDLNLSLAELDKEDEKAFIFGRYDPERPLLLEGDDPADLDILYLGMRLGKMRWDTVVLACPPITHFKTRSGNFEFTSFTQDAMQRSCNFGYILKVGQNCFEQRVGDKIIASDDPIYKAGQIVFFDEYHSQPRTLNEKMVYFISDVRLMMDVPEPQYFNAHLLVQDKLMEYREEAAKWRSMRVSQRLYTHAKPRL